jgi:hypothetical protein
LRLESGVYGERLLPEGQWLMEIKTPQAIPLWLARTLSELRLYPVSFSKYGREYLGRLAARQLEYGVKVYEPIKESLHIDGASRNRQAGEMGNTALRGER